MVQRRMRKLLNLALFSSLYLAQNFLLMAEAKMGSKEFFSKLSASNIQLVDDFYDVNVNFRDPLGEIKGVGAVKEYYAGLYKNVQSVRFDFDKQLQSGNEEVLFWTMYLKAKSLNGGEEFAVTGNSHIIFSSQSQKCIYHRDYFDMGEFIYERVPVLKSVISLVKDRLKHK